MGLPAFGLGGGRKHEAFFLTLPGVDLNLSGLFLERLAASDPEAEHVVIWDQAGFHPKPELHAVPARVHLVPLPPYSPELNPVEAIGDVIKDRIPAPRPASARASSSATSNQIWMASRMLAGASVWVLP